jgi:hypothetical protein
MILRYDATTDRTERALIATGFKFFDRFLAPHARKASAATGYFGGASAQTSKSSNTTFALGDHKYDSNSASPHPPYLETEMTQITKLDTPTFQDLTPVDAQSVTLIDAFQAGERIEIEYETDGPTPPLTLMQVDNESHIFLDGTLVARVHDADHVLTIDAITLIAV